MPSKEFINLVELLKSFPKTRGLTFVERRVDFEERSKQLPSISIFFFYAA